MIFSLFISSSSPPDRRDACFSSAQSVDPWLRAQQRHRRLSAKAGFDAPGLVEKHSRRAERLVNDHNRVGGACTQATWKVI